MAEEQGKIASMGSVQRVTFDNNVTNQSDEIDDNNENLSDDEKANIANGLNKDGTAKPVELTDDQKKKNLEAGLNEDGSAKNIELTDDQKKKNIEAGLNEDGTPKTPAIDEAAVLNFLNSMGKKVKSLDDIKSPEDEISPEQKLKNEQAFEKRMLDYFVENGGTVDQFSLMKQIASADLTQLSEKELELELTAAGFDEEQKKMVRQERYYQLDDEAIESLDDENEKALAKKKKEFGSQKLSKKAEYKQKLAVGFFDKLKQAIEEKDAEATTEKELAQKVDSHFEKLPRKMTFQLGKTKDNVEIAPIEMDVPDSVIADVRESLKNTDQRNKILYNKDGSLNIAALSEILVRNKVLETALNESYLTGVSRNTAEFEKTFPIRDANAIGTGSLAGGGNLNKTKSKIASFGKVERV